MRWISLPRLGKTLAYAALACLFLTIEFSGPVRAADGDAANPLQFWTGDGGSYLNATIKLGYGLWGQDHSWFGYSAQVLGKSSNFYQEAIVRPGLEGLYVFSDHQKVYGSFNVTQADTFGGIDAAGTNAQYGNVVACHLEDAYAGWKSGDLFRSLPEDFLDVSFGRQAYKIGTGFLFWNEGDSGGRRGAWWLGNRNDADYAGIVRLRNGGWSADLLYLESDDLYETHTSAGGVTMDYKFDKVGNIGGGIYSIDSQHPIRGWLETMMVYDAHGWVKPLAIGGPAALAPLKLEGEFAYDCKAHEEPSDSGWYSAASYQFDHVPWTPELQYRYASFGRNYDMLFTGFYDWEYWWQGENIGEFVKGNSNLDTHMVQLRFQPLKPLDIRLVYLHYDLNSAAAAGASSRAYADEFDFITDWTINKHLCLSFVGVVTKPDAGFVQSVINPVGGNQTHNWLTGLVCAIISY